MGMKFPKKLQEIRALSGWKNRSEAALALGCSEKTLGNYERGERQANLEFIARLAVVAGADFLELVRLRLADAGMENPDIAKIKGSRLPDDWLRVAMAPPPLGTPENEEKMGQIRREILESGVSRGWALLLMQLVAGRDITNAAALAIIQMLKDCEDSGHA